MDLSRRGPAAPWFRVQLRRRSVQNPVAFGPDGGRWRLPLPDKMPEAAPFPGTGSPNAQNDERNAR